jgi:hypothetical protein
MGDRSLYDTDILAWSEQQAAALRGLAGRRDLPNALDLENLTEEVESVGRSQLAAVESRIRLILAHLAKAVSSPPGAPALRHWRTECVTWQGDLLQLLSPSMLGRLDLERLWRLARREAAAALDEHDETMHPGLGREPPVALPDLLDEDFDLIRLADRVRARLDAA